MSALEKLVERCNEMDITEQLNWLGDAIMPYDAKKELAALREQLAKAEAERDEAVKTSNDYRQRVIDFCDGLIKESQHTAAIEESRGLDPIDRYEYQRAVEKIKKVFMSHNYLKEAQLAGSYVAIETALKGDS